MKNKIKKSTLLAIIGLTLLLHLLFLYFFTTIPFSAAPDRISEIMNKLFGTTSEQPEEKPQLQSHAPQQSAPVIFRDTPEEEPIKQQALPPEPKTLVSHAANPMNNPAKEKEITQSVPEPIREPQDRQGARVEEKSREQEHEENVLRAPPIREPQDRQDERSKKATTPPEKKPKLQKQKLESTMLAELEIQKKPSPSVRPSPSAEASREDWKPIEGPLGGKPKNKKSAPQLNLAQLSQQFMQKMATVETGGHGTLRVEGNAAYGHPSAYQIALERYVAKMCSEIETAYRISSNQSIQGTQHKPFNLLVELNSNGALNTIYPSPSSGLARIDEFAISIFRSASKSFPKLPEAMGTTLRIQFGINHIDHLAQLSQGVLTSR